MDEIIRRLRQNSMGKIVDKIWRFFSSVKFAIVLILSIIATAIIGTVIQQGLPAKEYMQHFGASAYKLLNYFDLFDMYHSWWFDLLLILFIVNVTVCSLERLPAIFKMVSKPKLKIPAEKMNAFKEKQTISYDGKKEEVISTLKAGLKETYKKPVYTHSEEGDFLYLEKGLITRFGPYITHISLIIMFIGVLIGSFMGFEAYVNLSPGDSTSDVRSLRGNMDIPLPFKIKCNDFNIEFYNSGMPKAYKSDLSLFSGGREVAHKIIDVNKPLTYKGITLYQASYGQAGASTFNLVLTDSRNNQGNLTLRLNQLYTVNGDTSISVLDYSPNYQGFGPAILVGVYKGQKPQGTYVYLQKYPGYHGDEKVGGFKLKFTRARESYYTGLQVAMDPGAPFVATGAIILIIGLIMSFFSYRRRIWIFMPDNSNHKLTIVGVADRNKSSFKLEFENIVNRVKDLCSPPEKDKRSVPSSSKKDWKDKRS